MGLYPMKKEITSVILITDGVVTFKSKKSSIWPVLLMINPFSERYMYIINITIIVIVILIPFNNTKYCINIIEDNRKTWYWLEYGIHMRNHPCSCT